MCTQESLHMPKVNNLKSTNIKRYKYNNLKLKYNYLQTIIKAIKICMLKFT